MKESTKEKIQEAIDDLKQFGGLKDPKLKEVVNKLKKAIKETEKSKK
jgi:polyhydroxyalkanoate synthesis regulator phasin